MHSEKGGQVGWQLKRDENIKKLKGGDSWVVKEDRGGDWRGEEWGKGVECRREKG